MRIFALLASAAAVAFMSETCDVVVVKGVRMNKADADAAGLKGDDEDQTELPPHTGAVQVPSDPSVPIPPAPSAPSFEGNPVAPNTVTEDTLSVSKEGRKFYVVKANDGSKVENVSGIDKDGYKTDGDAWAAIMAYKRDPVLADDQTAHLAQMPKVE